MHKLFALLILAVLFVGACSPAHSAIVETVTVEVTAEPVMTVREVIVKSESRNFVVMRDIDATLIDNIISGTICELLDDVTIVLDNYHGSWYRVNCQDRIGYVPVNCIY